MEKEKGESYKHNLAKKLLAEWLKPKYARVVIEDKFSIMGKVAFCADIGCYDSKNGLVALYEVVHTHDVNVFKQWKMNLYFHIHNWKDIEVYTISSDWILSRVKQPKTLNCLRIL
jgi:hypothetical protein